MTAQINLFDSSQPKKSGDLLTLTKVVGLAFVLYTLLGGAALWYWQSAQSQQSEADRIASEIKGLKAEMDALGQNVAKPDPQLVAELDRSVAELRRREETARSLEIAFAASQSGFSDFLRALARPIPEGLWLTGVTLSSGGSDIEVRGSLVNTAALPDFIQRLGSEPSFRGRTFSAMTLNRASALPVINPAEVVSPAALLAGPAPTKLVATTGAFVGVMPPPPPKRDDLPGLIDFVLVPKANGQDAKGGGKR